MKGGFAGNILYVNLTDREIRKEPTDADTAERFIGGLGLTIKLAYDSIKPGTDPMSPENPIIIGAGPLVGTNIPSASRIYSMTKLPSSGTIGWSGAGGANFAWLFKNAGYDHVVIKGRADRLVYLEIINDEVTIRDATRLKGMGVDDTCDELKKNAGMPAGVISIGKAGENCVLFSMAFVDKVSTLGRGGFGAVMGSKNLKAIVVKGSLGIAVADRNRYNALLKPLLQSIRDYPYTKEWQDLGMIKSFPVVPVDLYKSIRKRRISCVSCPVGCKDIVEIPDGVCKGLVKHTSSVVNLYTPMLYGFTDYRESIKFMSELDSHGMDMFEFFGIMNLMKLLAENGIIPRSSLDTEINTGSIESMSAWADKISSRNGLGNILAGGFSSIIKEYGRKAEEVMPPLIKGMHPYTGPGSVFPWDLFGTMELSQVLDPRGPHVGSGGSPTYFAKRPLKTFPRHLSRMGIPDEAVSRMISNDSAGNEDLKVGSLLRYSHRWFTALGSLGICARAGINRFYDASLCAELYEAVTGIKTSSSDLLIRVDRAWTLFRLANIREGISRKDETPPEKWFIPPGYKNYATENPLKPGEVETMIEDYYEEWGWDRKTGVPAPDILQKLGLP